MSFIDKHNLLTGACMMTLRALLFVGFFLTPIFNALAAGSDTTNVTVKADVISPACVVVMTPSTLPSLNVDSATLSTDGVSATESVVVSLKDCVVGNVSKRPVVTLSGSHPKELLPPGADVSLAFKDPADPTLNTSQGFWVVVGRSSAPTSATAEYLFKDGDDVFEGVSQIGDSGKTTSNTIYIGVSCLTATPCGEQAGTLKASLTFTFAYQ